MNALADSATLFALTGVLLVALGFYGFVAGAQPIRKVIAFNIVASGVFLLFGATGRTEGTVDPVAQALIITGLVVGVAITTFALALIVRRAEDERSKSGEEARE
ncbi:hypothetical protein E5163_11960 [Marinicauda algicola]|uniref:Na+/H+ antiporter subunit C n=1 Tax=Marinicauda algicola TaxID=2029849 RepID=A0A4S2H0B6_9PROT|nr:NADH-quinone oxidoreductase subunit K [Marinicauda algicola]TGY88522.1 hypothetical protein E5163_11960 [Marinicauda algicola]